MMDWSSGPAMFYNRQGEPLTVEEWGLLHEVGDEMDYRRVAEDHIIVGDEPLWVSTVWVGLDMGVGFLDGGPPLIFETMVFGHGDRDGLQWRWPTEEAALAGHDRVVAELLATTAARGD